MALSAISSAPACISNEEYDQLSQQTPQSFQQLPPVLRLKVDNVACQIQSGSTESTQVQKGSVWVTENAFSFLSESNQGFTVDYPSISLHAVSRSMPSSLEAIANGASTSTNPSTNGHSSSNSSNLACLYCQISNGEDQEDEAEEEDGIGNETELWILPSNAESLEPLFEALSQCASLHPSGNEEDDSGNPFASIGAFGTGDYSGAYGEQEEGAFDDAEADAGEATEGLTEGGRSQLARLEALLGIQGDEEEQEDSNSISENSLQETTLSSSPAASFHSSDPRSQNHLTSNLLPSSMPNSSRSNPSINSNSNSLLFTNLPEPFFTEPSLASSLLDLLNAYGPLVSWNPLQSLERATVVYEKSQDAKLAKDSLDRLLLPFEDDDDVVNENEEGSRSKGDETPKRGRKGDSGEGSFLRVYFGPPTAIIPHDPTSTLSVPSTDKNFLISPPGSPPVGWEPIREDPPNRDTLAEDLIRALGALRDEGRGVSSNIPKPLSMSRLNSPSFKALEIPKRIGEPEDFNLNDGDDVDSKQTEVLPPPTLVFPPTTAPKSIRRAMPGLGQKVITDDDEDEKEISVPGVTVQSYDPVDSLGNSSTNAVKTGLSISSVKATVDSMRGISTSDFGDSKGDGKVALGAQVDQEALPNTTLPASNIEFSDGLGSSRRITPTAMPPLRSD